MSEYRIIEITGNDGYPRTDGRYPLRIGRICSQPKPTKGSPLFVEYLRERDGSDYFGWLRTSKVIDFEISDTKDKIVVQTKNSRYVFEKVM